MPQSVRQRCRPRAGGGESLVRGRLSASWSEGDFGYLGGALESLFDARSGDDVVAVAEAEGCLQRALVVPEVVELLTQTLELGCGGRVVALRQDVPQRSPPLACFFDLLVDLGEGHVLENAVEPCLIPEGRGRKRQAPRRRPRPPRSRSSSAQSPSAVPQLGQLHLVEAEVVRELVEDGHPDLVLQQLGVVAEGRREGPAVDGDLRGQIRRLL